MSDPFALAQGIGEEFEGFFSKPYLCPAHVWTYGFGSTRDLKGDPVTANTPPITIGQARALMRRDLTAAFNELKRDVKVPLTDNQGAALMDFIYNLGAGAFRTSTLLRYLNNKNYAAAALEMDKWDHANGVEMAGLLRRREAEKALFNKAD